MKSNDISKKNKTIELFGKFLLTIPTKLKHHQDELSNTKALFIIELTLITILQGVRIKT